MGKNSNPAIKTFKPAQNNNERSENKLSADIAKKNTKRTPTIVPKKTSKKNNTSTGKSSASVNTVGGKHNICTSTNPVTKTHK